MKAAQIVARLTLIIEATKRMEARAMELAKQAHPAYREAAESGGLGATVEAVLKDLERLVVDAKAKR